MLFSLDELEVQRYPGLQFVLAKMNWWPEWRTRDWLGRVAINGKGMISFGVFLANVFTGPVEVRFICGHPQPGPGR